jgi:hypothetical protein
LLHNRETKWTNYQTKIEEAINLHTSLKSTEELDTALTNFTSILKESVLQATPILTTQARSVNIPLLEQQQQRRMLRKLWPEDLRMIVV